MKKNLILALVLAAANGLLAQEKAADKQKPPAGTLTFPAGVEMVTVDVVVTDKKGASVTGLSEKDFRVFEDGRPQTVSSFEAVVLPASPSASPPPKPRVSINTTAEARTGRSFVLLFDDVHLNPLDAQRAKAAAIEFLKKGVREGDRVMLVSSAGDAWWTSRMEAGREELVGLLKRLEGRRVPDTSRERVTEFEAMRIHVYSDTDVTQRVSRRFETYGVTQSQAGRSMAEDLQGDPYVRGRAAEVYMDSVSRNKITLGILERVLQSLTSARGRKSLILISEGFIYDPNLPEFKEVVEASRRSNCAMYFLDVRGLGGLPVYMTAEFGPAMNEADMGAAFAESFEASEGSESIAADSGGFSVRNTNDLGKGIQKIANESRVYYLLGYHPVNTVRDGGYRKIKVDVLGRKGIEIRARKGYFAPVEEGTKAARKSTPDSIDPQFQQAVDSPYDVGDVPLRMTAFVLEETLLAKARTIVATDVDTRALSFEEADGRFVDSLEFLLVANHRETGEFFRYDQKIEMKLLPETRAKMERSWFPILREFELPPGGYHAKIVVRDTNSGKIGTVLHEFEVPPLGGLRISAPFLSDVLQQPGEESGAKPFLIPTVRRTFAPGSSLYCQYEVYGAAIERSTGMPKVSAGFVIQASDGTKVGEMAPTLIKPTSLGKLSRLFGSRLPEGPAGEYQLTLTVKDEIALKSIEVREPFSIAAN